MFNRFGMTLGWVIIDQMFIFVWTNPIINKKAKIIWIKLFQLTIINTQLVLL